MQKQLTKAKQLINSSKVTYYQIQFGAYFIAVPVISYMEQDLGNIHKKIKYKFCQ